MRASGKAVHLTDRTIKCGRSVDREEDWFPRSGLLGRLLVRWGFRDRSRAIALISSLSSASFINGPLTIAYAVLTPVLAANMAIREWRYCSQNATKSGHQRSEHHTHALIHGVTAARADARTDASAAISLSLSAGNGSLLSHL